jgi:hypothetical protein
MALPWRATESIFFSADGVNIYSFSIATDGSLKQVSSINAQQYNGQGQCGGGPEALFLDHTGADLYDVDGSGCSNTAYESFSINNSTGALTFLAITSAQNPSFESPLSFIGNNLYGYSSSCFKFFPLIYGFARNGDGTLTALNQTPQFPRPASGDVYCPYLAAADTTNRLAIPLVPTNSMQPAGPAVLSVYTADSAGNLTTNSTVADMPPVAVGNVNAISASPMGDLVAVGGAQGLQVFHFNGASAITPFTTLLTTDAIDQLAWDNNNHLYAISRSAGKLHVFTATAASVTEVSGSPYAVVNPKGITVLPKS